MTAVSSKLHLFSSSYLFVNAGSGHSHDVPYITLFGKQDLQSHSGLAAASLQMMHSFV